jgi:hypothetical protein
MLQALKSVIFESRLESIAENRYKPCTNDTENYCIFNKYPLKPASSLSDNLYQK